MKKLMFFVFTIIFSFTLNAQKFDIVQSKIFKDKKKHSFLTFSLDDGAGGLITIRRYNSTAFGKHGYYIQHFNKQLALENEFDYEIKRNQIKNAFVKDGKLYLIEFNQNRKEKTISYSALSSDIKKFDFSSKELLSISEKNFNDYFNSTLFPFFWEQNKFEQDANHLGEVVMSENKKFFTINFDIKNKKEETHRIFVFNDSLELVYDKLITKKIKDYFFDYNSIDVSDNDGTVYFLGKSYENDSRQRKKKGKANYHFELTKVNKTTQKTVSFKEDDKFIGSLSLVKKNNQLTCIGFYGNKRELKYNGIAVFKLNPSSLTIDTKKFNPFSEEFLFDKYGDNEAKKKRKGKKGIRNIDFKNIEVLNNGDLIINAEEFYITTHQTSDPNGFTQTRTVYHFDDIVSCRIDANGDLLWARNINKAQVGFRNSSFTSITTSNTTNLFINCSDRIRKISGDRIKFGQTSAKRSNLYCVKITHDGVIDFEKLIDDKDSKVFYKVNNGIISDHKNEIIFLGKKKKNSQIMKIKITK